MIRTVLGRLFGRPRLPEQLGYEAARAVLERNHGSAKRELAVRADAEPEMLFYLAADADPAIRRSVAANPATPGKADILLARDADDDVRAGLARKIARLVPTLSAEEAARARDLAIEALETLAADHLPRIRAIVSEEIKRATNVPARIVRQLANDVELIVAAPVLEYSPLLSDDDLVEIVATGRVAGAVAAIARREQVGSRVADAVVATLDVPAVAALLANPNAQIREDTLDRIIDHAASVEAWHKPMVMRAELSLRAVRRIAGFVASALLEQLQQRSGLDEATKRELAQRVRERLKTEHLSIAASGEDPWRLAVEAEAQGELTDEALCEAADGGRRSFVVNALALRAQVPPALVERVMAAQSPKAVAALAWKARFAMRTALKLQEKIARIPRPELLLPRGGVDYPLDENEIAWHLRYFGMEP